MFTFLSNYLQNQRIELFSLLPLSALHIKKPYLLERSGIQAGSVILMAVPYLTPAALSPDRNLSAYAVSKDYHLYFKNLFDDLIPRLSERYPQNRFAGFADHSPIDEIHAAALGGLGIIGDNGLLITEKYASYVFLGEIITDAVLEHASVRKILYCEHCGACRAACPMHGGVMECLSALTQKKGDFSNEEEMALSVHPTLWGCDICQEICPHTESALASGSIFSPIPFFQKDPIPRLTIDILDGMSDTEFSTRAYAWRGRAVIRRNLQIKEEGERKC